MTQNIKRYLVYFSSAIVMLVSILAPVGIAQASISPSYYACGGISGTLSGKANCNTGGSDTGIATFLSWAVNIFSAIVGIIAVVMIIVGGLKYITSGGDSSKVGSAKNTLLYAIIGLIIVVMAQVIVHFVLAEVRTHTGGDNLNTGVGPNS
jgi:hypothetical protein